MTTFFKDAFWSNEMYKEYVRGLQCFRCGAASQEECSTGGKTYRSGVAHHERVGGFGGTALKPSDVFLLPLCGGCHGVRHSSDFITLADYYKDPNSGWNADVRREMTKARIAAAQLKNLNQFLFRVRVQGRK
jgi:hypothetical protein